MRVTRHFLDIGTRRVHYRLAGSGPPLLMAHQSPRSSVEYEPLMAQWAAHFTCIAPDTPGFGQSDPLPDPHADIDAFADAMVAFLDALGVARTAAYGYHSGGIILVTAAKRHPERFTALVTGGYAIWTQEEMAAFAADYLPPFRPQAYGEHLTWLWNRILEQTWFFPWYDVRNATRLPTAHADPLRVDVVVREMLDAGDAYRAGYGAVLRAPRDIPDDGEATPPVLILAYDGDPLQSHLARLGRLPASWRAEAVRDAAALEHLLRHPAPATGPLPQADDAGFVSVVTAGFCGSLHWRGDRTARRVVLHGPGRSAELLAAAGALLLDLPGHGLSDDWPARDAAKGAASIDAWVAVLVAALTSLLDVTQVVVVGEGLSSLLAPAVARAAQARGVAAVDAHVPLPDEAGVWIERAIPHPEPDRFGGHLTRAWSAVRAEHLFWPWFMVTPAHAIPFDPADLAPESLALAHRSLIRARAGRALLTALLRAERAALFEGVVVVGWDVADWAKSRADVWRPVGI